MENFILFFAAASAVCTVSSLPARKYHFVYDPKSWSDAQTFCRQRYTDLATIDNMADVDVLNNMADLKQMVYSQFSYRAWIGLYTNAGQWKWADGSKFLFTHWKSGKPDKSTDTSVCAVAYFQESGSWEDEYCDIKRAFICYEAPVKLKVLEVKLVRTFSLDLEEPAVLADLLKQLEVKLQQQAGSPQVKVHFRRKEDGKIFHKLDDV
ncbi:L-selectin-like [Xiphophorus hellerii]|uniref:L-selectin-like n=1 Tax=Xiphophorus hellerii TaxID=8084 RepID=UPI0013B3EADD|nr:L-selectin-like [Xiphophorus hellerii]XP_032423737.1 L-selectin-like [Xiphophorus hellerii]